MKKYLYSILLFVVMLPVVGSAATNIPLPTGTGLPEGTQKDGNYILPVIETMTKFVTSIIATIAILMIVIAGIMYMLSSGDSNKIEKAKTMLIYAIGGLIVALLAYSVVIAIGVVLEAWK